MSASRPSSGHSPTGCRAAPFSLRWILIRAAVALLLQFVDRIWQVYVLVLVLQSASAAFTPTFQATIPDVLRDEKD